MAISKTVGKAAVFKRATATKRDCLIQVRLTRREYDTVVRRAQQDKAVSLSQYVRDSVLADG